MVTPVAESFLETRFVRALVATVYMSVPPRAMGAVRTARCIQVVANEYIAKAPASIIAPIWRMVESEKRSVNCEMTTVLKNMPSAAP